MMQMTQDKDRLFWVVVADEAQAIVYTRDSKSGPLREVSTLANDAARMKASELISDSGGRRFDSQGGARHTMVNERVDAKTHAAQLFAKQIAGRVAKTVHDGTCRGFALVAAPRFLGVLRDSIAVATSMEPYATINKAVVGKDTATIEKLLTDA